MSQTLHPALSDRFALIIEGLCGAVARRCGLGGLAGPFIILVWSRLRRLAARFARHAASPIASRPQAALKAAIAREAKPSRRRPEAPLPRRRAWLLRLAPEAASGASQLRHFLADPETAALLAQAPQLRRILRPLCHMLGLRAAGIRAAQALPPLLQSPPQPPDPSSIARHAPRAVPAGVPPITVFPNATPPLSPDAPPAPYISA